MKLHNLNYIKIILLYPITMNRDFDYENSNIGYDDQYTEEDG